jgi:hypothetical protein
MSFDNTNQGGDSGNQGFGGNDSNQGSFNQGGVCLLYIISGSI